MKKTSTRVRIKPESLRKLLPQGISLPRDPAWLADLSDYIDLLRTWNRALNLVGFQDAEKIMRLLVCDSFHLAHFLNKIFAGRNMLGAAVWEPGAGAGLPGIPLRMVWHDGIYTMIEARQKRAIFLANVLARLKLADTLVFRGRAEDFFASREEAGQAKAACVISRAFMPWKQLLPFCGPHLADDGIIIIMASRPAPELPTEWRLDSQYEYNADNNRRWLWALGKKTIWK